MTELRTAVIDEATHRSRTLSAPELVALIERHHTEFQGVDRETLVAYGEALDERLVDTGTWVSDDTLYDLGDGRISAYPRDWHERLGGETDVREYVRYLKSDESGFEGSDPYDDAGIEEPTLLDVVPIVGRTDRDAVKAQIEDRRAAGEITEGPDQHPDARVRLDRSSS